MKKSIIVSALALTVLGSMASAQAFGGGMGRGGMEREFSPERYEQMKTLFSQNPTYETFKAALEAKKASKKTEQEAFKNSITRSVENISNGVVITLTSTNADAVKKLQEKKADKEEADRPDQATITHSVENISNGVKITITSTDASKVSKIQAREAQKGEMGMGRSHGKGFMKGFKRGMKNPWSKAQ